MGLVTNGLKIAGFFAGKRKYKIMIVSAQLVYMGTKYILERQRKSKLQKNDTGKPSST